MGQIPGIVLSVVITYFAGAIPTAYIFGRILKGIDIRKHGSGNIGATNAFRVLGKGPGAVVLAIDVLKGLVPLVVLANIFGFENPLILVFLGLVAVAGHNWTVFLNFKGGKGIATSLGVLIALAIQVPTVQPVLLVTVGVWVVVFLLSGYVSAASILAVVALPITMVIWSVPLPIIIMGIILCIFIVFRHRPNIQRLIEGKEPCVLLPTHKLFKNNKLN